MTFEKKRVTLAEARIKAEKYCAYQERCHSEVMNKLFDLGLKKDECDDILIHLIQHKFLNEERFAKAFVRGKFRTKGWGRKKIIYQLKLKGINERLIEQALQEIDALDYTDTLKDLIEKKDKTMKETDHFKKMASLTRYLMTKGYEAEMVIETLKKYYHH